MLIRTPTGAAPRAPGSAVAPEVLAAARAEEQRAPAANARGNRAAAVAPSSYDATARTVEVVLSAGAPVRRWSFTEELEISATAIDLGRVTAGHCRLLDSHNQWSIDDVLGTVLSARIEAGNLIGLLQFAETDRGRQAEGMVSRGELTSISIGYQVKAWTQITVDENGHETWRATAWELLEASLVPVPADPAAGVRSAVIHPGDPGAPAAPQEEKDMIRTHTGAAAAVAASLAAADPALAIADAARAAPAAPAPVAPVAPAAEAVRFTAVEAVAFVGQARALGVETQANDLVGQNERGEISPQAARDALLRAAADRQRTETTAVPAGSAARTNDSQEASRNAIVDALTARATRSTPSDQAREFMGVRMLELARERAGLSPRERDPITILRAANTTSDFPLILEAAANKILLMRYSAATPTYRMIAQRRDLNDFKTTKLLRAGDFPTLQAYKEDGEIKAGTINEGRETVILGSYGRILRMTRQMIINDDLGAFDDVAGSIGRMIARFENSTFYAMKGVGSGLGPTLADGKRLFHADHGNLTGSGTAIDVTSLGVGRAAMRKQTDLDGNPLNLAAAVLLVGPDRETVAEQYTAQVQPVINSSVNPFAGRLTVVTDASITGNAWELYANPDDAAAFSYGYLADAPGPRVLTEEPFNVDGVAFRATLDFYAGAIDYRPAYRNAGA
jgi:HK97 family phage prohead protease